MTTPFEDQLAVALRERGRGVAVPRDGRAAIDRRIARRARDRRARRLGAAAVLVVLVVVGTVAVVRRGRDDARVVTVPGIPAVHLPQLGLPPGAGTNRLGAYTPGRQVYVELEPTSGEPGGQITVSVTDASLTDVAHASGHWTGGEPTTVAGRPALAFPAIAGGPQTMASVVWQPADHVVAELVALNPGHADQPAATAEQLASSLVELDDATWSALVDPPGLRRMDSALGLFGKDGHTEMSAEAPGATDGSGGVVQEVLDVPGYAPGTFSLWTYYFADDSQGPPLPLGIPDSTGPTAAGSDGSDTIEVRGTTVYIDPPPDADVPDDYPSHLIWNVDRASDRVQYRLQFSHAIAPQEAARVVDRLSAPTPDEWHALLFPSMLRIDLVPMPEFQATGAGGETGTTGG